MDFQVVKERPTQWGLVVGLSGLLWVVPISVGAPPFFILFSLLGAIAGFGYSGAIAQAWKNEERAGNKLRLQREELENYQLALEEDAIKFELRQQFLPEPVQAVQPGSEHGEFFGSRTVQQSPEPAAGDGQEVSLNRDESSEPESEPAEPTYYTTLNLTADEARDLLRQLSQCMSSTDIIKQLWGANRGGNAAYKQAKAEFEMLTKG